MTGSCSACPTPSRTPSRPSGPDPASGSSTSDRHRLGARLAAWRGAAVTGVDIAPGMLEAAEMLSAGLDPRPNFQRGAAEALPFDDEASTGCFRPMASSSRRADAVRGRDGAGAATGRSPGAGDLGRRSRGLYPGVLRIGRRVVRRAPGTRLALRQFGHSSLPSNAAVQPVEAVIRYAGEIRRFMTFCAADQLRELASGG